MLSFSKETLIIEQDKNASNIESLEQEKVDEEEEGKKDESSCSSEEDEEEDSESEAETGNKASAFLDLSLLFVAEHIVPLKTWHTL